MEIIEAILKIYPDWKGVVWENDYKRIAPHVLEKRPIPTMDELESAWKGVVQDMDEAAKTAQAEELIRNKMRELAVNALVSEGKLSGNGKLAKEIKE